MTFQVVFQPGAQRDLWAAAGWIEEQSKSPAKALRWVRGVRAKIETLKSNPTRCPVDADSEAYGEEVRVCSTASGTENTGFSLQYVERPCTS